jgi:excisionase family DNA binding protein
MSERRTSTETDGLVSVSVAARMLGVSASSLRAWAAAGLVPHRRTPGGHRRFDPAELEQWLAARGGRLPHPAAQSPPELLPTRIDALPELAGAIRRLRDLIVEEVESELAAAGARMSPRTVSARRRRISAAVETLADAIASGDLAGSFREAEWQGYRGGTAQGADTPLTEVLAFRRAVEQVAAADLAGRPTLERRALERALDRMAIRTVIGFAEGLRGRRRSAPG